MPVSFHPERGAPSLLHRETGAHPAPFSRVVPLQFRGAPMLFAAGAFAAGVLCSSAWWRPASLLVLAVAALLVVSFIAVLRAPHLALAATLLVWVALGWACGGMRPRAVSSRALQPYEDGLRRDVTGIVTGVEKLPAISTATRQDEDPLYPNETAISSSEQSALEAITVLDLYLTGIEDVTPDVSRIEPVKGGVRLTVYAPHGSIPAIRCGGSIRTATRLHPPQQYRDPGVWQREQFLAESGVVATGSAKAEDIKTIQTGSAPLPCRLAAMRQWASRRVTGFAGWQQRLRLPHMVRWTTNDAGVLNAMLFGDRVALTHRLRLQFERTGTFHLFVVAGMHVTLLAAGVYWLLIRLRTSAWVATCGSLGLTAAYALLTGFGAPVQRALLMTAAYMATRLLARERSVLNAVGVAALAMMIVRPQVCFDAGFQMTVLVVLAIGGAVVPIIERTTSPYARACQQIHLLRVDQHAPPRIAQFRVTLRTAGEELARVLGWRWLMTAPAFTALIFLRTIELTMVALTTEIVMAVPMAVLFHRVTPFALPANLLVLPLLPLLMVSGLATFLLLLLSSWAALLPGVMTAVLLHAISFVVGRVGSLQHADWRIPAPPAWATFTVLLLFCAAALLLRMKGSGFGRTGVLLLPFALVILLLPYPARLHAGELEITAIDVGQGDSLLVAGPDGSTMLIDAGGQVGPERPEARGSFDIGDDVVSPYLWGRGIRTLDVLVLTHAHMDHIGGMDAVLRNFRPRELWLSVEPDSAVLRNLLADAANRRVAVHHLQQGDSSQWGGVDVQVVSPAHDYHARSLPANDDSLVLRFDYGQSSAMLEGDAEQPSEQRMLRDGLLRPTTLLQAGHHGSNTSTTAAFLAVVKPKAAVISCGRGNRFGHPRMPVLQRLQAAGVATSRTDTMGATQYLLERRGMLRTEVLTSNTQ